MSKSFVFVLLLAIGGLCGLALLTRDLKVGSGEIRERRSQIKNGVRIQTRKLKLGTTYLAALFPWHGLAALPRNGCALLLRVVEAVLFRHIVALLVPNHVARLRWHVLALLPLHLNSRKRMRRGLLQRLGGLERLFTCLGTTPPFWEETLRQTGRELEVHCCLWTDGGFSLDGWRFSVLRDLG